MSESTSPSSDRNRLAAQRNQRESERIDLVRRIPYTLTKSYDEDEFVDRHGTGISVNITSQGMLLMMEEVPKTEQVMNVRVPTPSDPVAIPTLAEVRWTKRTKRRRSWMDMASGFSSWMTTKRRASV